MKDESPLTRLVDVRSLPQDGTDVFIDADAAQRAALASELGLEAVKSLSAHYRVTRSGRDGALLRGRLKGTVTRQCVVTLEPFDAEISEPVEVLFASEAESARKQAEWTAAYASDDEAAIAALGQTDPPDPIVDGRIDAGRVTVEFLALSLDPYPRKPGAAFEAPGAPETPESNSPFAALAQLKESDKNRNKT